MRLPIVQFKNVQTSLKAGWNIKNLFARSRRVLGCLRFSIVGLSAGRTFDMPFDLSIIGKRFGRLIILSSNGKAKRGGHLVLCRCDCGKEKQFHAGNLKHKKTKSCGCLTIERLKTHGHTLNRTRTPEYGAWKGMRNRCYRRGDRGYKNYGGRGIVVCDKWLHSFESFFEDMGFKPTKQHSLDRINNDGNYEPGNCRWATKIQQCNNVRTNRNITLNGVTKTIAEWSREISMPRMKLYLRLCRGWTIERAILTP